MKKVNVFNIVLSSIVILGNIVLGVTILTYLIQHVSYNKILIGLIILATALMGLTEFFTLKFATRIRSIQNAVGSLLAVALGIVILLVKLEMRQVCIIWGIGNIVLAVIHIVTGVLNILRKPLINGVRIILNVLLIIFSIIVAIKTIDYLNSYLTYIGIALLIEAAILLVEFIISRYQN